jgi:sn-glycerol 3-phosphate transport system substrate-binding protein
MQRATLKTLAAAAVLTTNVAVAQTEIQWWHAMGGQNTDKINEIAERFNASQDDYEVVPTYKGNYTETMTGAIAAFRADQQPHIVQVFEVGTATMMAAEGAIRPVHEIMADADTDFDPDAYLPAVKSYYTTPDGRMLSLPFNSSTPVLWYNKDAFERAGLDPEQPPRTWNEVEQAAGALVDSGMECGLSFGWQSWVMVENFSAWHDLPIGTAENGFAGLDTELTFNNDQVVQALERIADMQSDGRFVYGGRRGDSLPMFTNGECGMWMNSSAYLAGIESGADFEFGQTMLPVDTSVTDSPQNSIIGGATLWALAGHPAEDYDGVAAFYNFLSSDAIQYDWHEFTGYVPITQSAYEAARADGHYQRNPGADIAIEQLSLNEPTPNSKGLRFGNFVQIRDVINEEMEAIWSGDKSASEAMDAAVERGNRLLRRFEAAN